MSLALNKRRLLPDGIHESSLGEIEVHFGRFQHSSRRCQLFVKLVEYVQQLKAAGLNGSLIIDGSFVMGCVDEPGDIDLILILPPSWDVTAPLNPFLYNLLSRREIKRKFPFDVFTVRPGSIEEQKWTEFFSQINVKWYDTFGFPENSTKGLVRIGI